MIECPKDDQNPDGGTLGHAPRLLVGDGRVLDKRVSVLRGTRSVPLLPGTPKLDSLKSPWSGLIIEKHLVGAVEIPFHEHPTLCIHLQTTGPVEMDWNSAGRSGHIRSTRGDLILLAPGTRDSLLWYGTSERVIASVSSTLLVEAARQLEMPALGEIRNIWSLQDDQLRLLLTEMEREMSSGWSLGSLYGDLLSMAFSVALLKKYAQFTTLKPPFRGGLSRNRLRHVVAFIEEHLEHDIRLGELAALTGLSIFHFARSFRESTGITPHRFVVQMRVERAKSLLTRSAWTVQQVASAVGIENASQFSKIFRASVGVAPNQWRRSN
ncbi:helix-turn-helix domain-containing protein [Terriglobus roseus]|nr:AraC family transcriptional regulator [Terriglobus roseus]